MHAKVTRSGNHYTLALELQGPDAQSARRDVTAASCDALADAAAVLIALALEPVAAPTALSKPAVSTPPESVPEERSEPIVPTPTVKEGAVSAPVRRADSAPDPATTPGVPQAGRSQGLRLAFDVTGALSVGTGMLPGGPRLGVRPQLALQVGPMRMALGGVFWFSRELQPAAYPQAQTRAGALLGDVALGVDVMRGRLALRPCVVLELGLLDLTTAGISMPAVTRTRWAALGGGLQIAYRLMAGLGVYVEGLGLVPLSRPRFVVQLPASEVELFESAPVALRVSVGISYVFE